jgi:hypothetical protein
VSGFDRAAGLASLVSAGVAAAAVILLAGMFAAFGLGATVTGEALGGLNDRLTLVAYLLAAPGVIATWRILGGRRPALVALGAVVALASIVAVVVLQWLLVTGRMTFEEQVGPVSIALMTLGAWFVLSGYLGGRDGRLPYGVGLGIAAMLYVGYPLLAWRLGRALLASPMRAGAAA